MKITKQESKATEGFFNAVWKAIEAYKIMKYGDDEEPMDGDEVDEMMKLVKEVVNENEGNV